MANIKPALPADHAAIAALWKKTGLMRPWNDAGEEIRRATACPTSEIFVAREGDKITGTVMAGYEGHRGWVYYLAVAPEHQKKGIATALLAHAENWLKEQGAPGIMLLIRPDNEQACAFYERLGYKQDGTIVMKKRF